MDIKQKYIDGQRLQDFHPGELVFVTRKATTEEGGWAFWWTEEMDDFIHKVCTIDKIGDENCGIKLVGMMTVYFPYFVLQKVTKYPFIAYNAANDETQVFSSQEDAEDWVLENFEEVSTNDIMHSYVAKVVSNFVPTIDLHKADCMCIRHPEILANCNVCSERNNGCTGVRTLWYGDDYNFETGIDIVNTKYVPMKKAGRINRLKKES